MSYFAIYAHDKRVAIKYFDDPPTALGAFLKGFATDGIVTARRATRYEEERFRSAFAARDDFTVGVEEFVCPIEREKPLLKAFSLAG